MELVSDEVVPDQPELVGRKEVVLEDWSVFLPAPLRLLLDPSSGFISPFPCGIHSRLTCETFW